MDVQPDPATLPTLVAYSPITRRKSVHGIKMPDGSEPYKAMKITDAICWLEANGWTWYRLATDRGEFLLRVVRIETR